MPDDGLSFYEIRKGLREFSKHDMPDNKGKLFSYVYESGNKELDRIREFYWEFMNKNALDFTVFPSVLMLENDIVAMTASLLNGNNTTVGNFTSGGTESNMLAVKSARDYHRANKCGGSGRPEVIIPSTGHPSFIKAADFFDMTLTVVPVDKKTFKVKAEDVERRINENTALIVGSAPSYPIGVIDPIESLGEIAIEKGVRLHVDACIGGFILPFFRLLGEKLPEFDFSVRGVTSISADLHKYGYAPKGASVILYRSKELRIHQLFTNASWPGYPMANTTLQSTRSEGPLAASWATLNYLGKKGYIELSKKVLIAREKLIRGLEGLGYEILGKPEASIVAFRRGDVNIFQIADLMKSKGWYLQVQPGSEELNNVASLHMTITAAHEYSIEPFIESLKTCTESVRNKNIQNRDKSINDVSRISFNPEELNSLVAAISHSLSTPDEDSGSQMTLINQLIRTMPSELVEKLFKTIVNEVFTPTRKDEKDN
ncbi:MAG: aspartate aminotransferase family protein [Candidatus Methanomethylicaceae archaeon]